MIAPYQSGYEHETQYFHFILVYSDFRDSCSMRKIWGYEKIIHCRRPRKEHNSLYFNVLLLISYSFLIAEADDVARFQIRE